MVPVRHSCILLKPALSESSRSEYNPPRVVRALKVAYAIKVEV